MRQNLGYAVMLHSITSYAVLISSVYMYTRNVSCDPLAYKPFFVTCSTPFIFTADNIHTTSKNSGNRHIPYISGMECEASVVGHQGLLELHLFQADKNIYIYSK